jgi:hypothetical protein
MPKPKVKLQDIEKLAMLQCTHREAAGFLDLRVSAFRQLMRKNPKVAEAWERGQQMGLVSLRRKQMALASHNATMAIFMGKQYLGQRDIVTNQHVGADGGPIDIDLSRLGKGDRDDLRALLTRALGPESSSSRT